MSVKVKTLIVLITLGKMSTVSKEVWPWELDVLEEKFGGDCVVDSESEAMIDELPDAAGEFARLQAAHGENEKTQVSHVENAYGRGRSGYEALGKAIKKSESKPPKAKKVKKVKAEKPAKAEKPPKAEKPAKAEKSDKEATKTDEKDPLG